MTRALILMSLLSITPMVCAALPEAVVEACLAPSITDTTANQTWPLMTANTWHESPIVIAETPEATLNTQPGKPHPLDWLVSEIQISTPNSADETTPLKQTLTIKVTAKGVVPKLTFTINFLDNALLPPCEVITWEGKVAVVSQQKDWYILATDPQMTVVQTAEKAPRTSIRFPNMTLEKFNAATGAIIIGEGPLQ
jgi:hypothetical protein